MRKEINEQLSWTCRGRGLIVHIGDYDVKKRFNMAVSMLVLLLFDSKGQNGTCIKRPPYEAKK